jgi:hypothetical protein
LIRITGSGRKACAVLTDRGAWFARTLFTQAHPPKEQKAMLQTATKPRPDLTGQAAINVMADDMRHAAGRDNSASERDLVQKGWTTAQIKTYGPDASAVAERRSQA